MVAKYLGPILEKASGEEIFNWVEIGRGAHVLFLDTEAFAEFLENRLLHLRAKLSPRFDHITITRDRKWLAIYRPKRNQDEVPKYVKYRPTYSLSQLT